MVNSISGINLKIGADLSELKKELGKVGGAVEEDLKPAQEPVKTLKENFSSMAKNAGKIAAIAVSLGKIGKELTGFTKGILEDALALNPETQSKVTAVKDAFTEMKQSLGESILPLIDKFAPKLESALDSLTAWIKEHPKAAENIVLIAGAVGALSSAAAVAGPALMLMNIGLAPISGTAIAVAAAIGGLVLIIGMLIDKSDELTQHTAATTEGIENMDTATQSLVQNGRGELEIWDKLVLTGVEADLDDKMIITNSEGKTGYYSDILDMYGLPIFVEVQQDAAEAVSATSEALTDQTTVMDSVTDSMDSTKTAAEQVNEILTGMQETLGGSETGGGIAESFTQMTDILESDAFKAMAEQPISSDVTESWETFGLAVSSATEGFTAISSAIEGNEDEGTTGLTQNLTSVKEGLDNILISMQTLAAYMQGDFVAAINTLMQYLCMTTTDSEGNVKADNGNTLYTSLGAISGVFGDIFDKCVRLEQEWREQFPGAVEIMKKASGKADGALEATAEKAWNAADAFMAAAAAVLAYLDALKSADEYINGGGGAGIADVIGSGNGPKFAAAGAHANAGDTFIVGEEGPELFTPHRSGYIIPNDELETSGGPRVTVNIEGSIYGESYLRNYVVNTLTGTIQRELQLAA